MQFLTYCITGFVYLIMVVLDERWRELPPMFSNLAMQSNQHAGSSP
jgi:hypothetical protein